MVYFGATNVLIIHFLHFTQGKINCPGLRSFQNSPLLVNWPNKFSSDLTDLHKTPISFFTARSESGKVSLREEGWSAVRERDQGLTLNELHPNKTKPKTLICILLSPRLLILVLTTAQAALLPSSISWWFFQTPKDQVNTLIISLVFISFKKWKWSLALHWLLLMILMTEILALMHWSEETKHNEELSNCLINPFPLNIINRWTCVWIIFLMTLFIF